MSVQNTVLESNGNVGTRSFRVIIKRTDENDGYIADIPSIHYCFAFGDSPEEALENLREALEGTLEMMIEDGTPIPDDSKTMETIITITNLPSLSVA